MSKRREQTDDCASNSAEDCSALEELYSAEYLRECADPEAREERIAELKRRIEADAYKVDADRIAEELLLRGDLS